MTSKSIVIVSGAPGTGKSTLVNLIREHVNIPIIEKDAIKEFYFEYIGHGDRELSKALGKAAIDAQFALAKQLLELHEAILLETAFYADIARNDFITLTKGYKVKYLELYCHVDEAVRRERFVQRATSGRHPGHADLIAPDEASENLERYMPLELGKVIKIDTGTLTYETEAKQIISQINDFIKE